MIDIVDAQLADLIRRVTVERGHGPGGIRRVRLRRRGRTARGLVLEPAGLSRGRDPARGVGVLRARHRLERRQAGGDAVRADGGAVRARRAGGGTSRPWRRGCGSASRPSISPRTTCTRRGSSSFSSAARCTRCASRCDRPTSTRRTAARPIIDRFATMYEARYGAGTAYRKAGVEAMTFVVEAIARLPVPELEWVDALDGATRPPPPAPGPSTSATARPRRCRCTPRRTCAPVIRSTGRCWWRRRTPRSWCAPGHRLWVDGLRNLRIDLGEGR